jgi:MFS family permease
VHSSGCWIATKQTMQADRPAGGDLTAVARWSLVSLLAAALFINYVDRGAVPTAAHLIQSDLGLSKPQLGVLLSGFFWTYAVLQIPAGWLAERYGAGKVLAAGLAVWACATMLVGVAHSFGALLMLRLLLGVGESAGFPCMSKLLATAVPVRSLGVANGIVGCAYLFGPAAGTYGGGLLMAHFGWRTTFWVLGALSLLWLLPWSLIRMPHPARQASGGSPGLPALLRQQSLWGASLGHFSTNYVFYFMLTWLPFYLIHERGLSTVTMASLAGSAYLVNALSALFAGWAIDRAIAASGRANVAYKSVMVAAHAGSVACMLCIALASPFWAFTAIFVYQILSGISAPGIFAIAQILAGPSASGRWVGIQNAVGNLAGVIAPAVAGVLDFKSAFFVAAIMSLLGLVGWVWMIPQIAPLTWPLAAGDVPLQAERSPS